MDDAVFQATFEILGSCVDEQSLMASGPPRLSDEAWTTLETAGLTHPAAAEELGGGGADLGAELAVVVAASKRLVFLPVAETILAGWLLAQAGLAIPKGRLTVAPVRRGEQLRLRDGLVSGTVTRIPWAAAAHRLVVLVEGTVGLIDLGRGLVEGATNLAAEPRDQVSLLEVPMERAAPCHNTMDTVIQKGALLRAAQMVGGLERALELSLQYSNAREQFGRPIGAFQAIQHQIAVMTGHTAAARAAVEEAYPDQSFASAAIAKLRAGEAAAVVCAMAHQIHGAMGVTREYPLHQTTLRLQSWRSEFGTEADWSQRLGERVLMHGPADLWRALTGEVELTAVPGRLA